MADGVRDGGLDDAQFIKDIEFNLGIDTDGKELKLTLAASDPTRGGNIALTLAVSFLNKAIKPPAGERIDVNYIEEDPAMSMWLFSEVLSNIDRKIDSLSSMGYDVSWVKPMLNEALAGSMGINGGDGGDGGDNQGFIFPNSSYEIIDPELLYSLSQEELMYARCEILARNGFVFENAYLDEYFTNMPWYYPLYDNESIVLSEIEITNLDMIVAIESMYN